MMDWLPQHPDLRAALKAAGAIASPSEQLRHLMALAQHRLGYLETIQLDNVLRRVRGQLEGEAPVVRLAVLASTTIDHLAPSIRIGGLRRGLLVDVYSGAYGQYRQELLDSSSALHAFAPQVVVFAIDSREPLSRIPVGATAADVERAIDESTDEIALLWRQAKDRFSASVIQQSIMDVTEPLFGSYDRFVPSAPSRVVRRMNDALADRASKDGVLVLDVAHASQRAGVDAWFDRSRWLQGKIEIAPAMAPMYGDLVARLIAAVRGQSKKCLVLDLDNTLWGGVIGDDGLEGIKLGEGSAVGEAHLALQRYARMLKDRGIILAVCSKNDPQIAESVFRDHPEMALRRSDIAAFVANWSDKATNLRTIAETLNIGLDSLVFVDDNPAERARIREALPTVAVPELPADPAHYVHVIADAGYFEAASFTEEDRDRSAQYVASAERDALRGSAQSMDEFLRDLQMTAHYGLARPVDLSRVTQLLNKTNQFNTTTIRYTQEEVARLASSELVLQFRLLDRFGDNGLVSVMILKGTPGACDTLEVDNWVMSCRVFGRQLETFAMNAAAELALSRHVRFITAEYRPTAKNAVIANLFESLGFDRESTSENGTSRWSMDLSRYEPRPTFIKTQVQ